MPTSLVARFIKGSRSQTITSGRYTLGRDFVPPAVVTIPQFAEGTSANRRGGGRLVGSQATNREWSFSVHVAGSSEAEVRRGVADLQYWLDQAGSEDEPLYLEVLTNSDAPKPLWGQGPKLYEVVYGRALLPDTYGLANRKWSKLADCRVNLVIKPYALGLSQRLASATGGVILDHYGTVDGRDRGVVLTGAMTNFATNPVFGHGTYDNGWTAQSNLVVSKNTDPAFLLPGTRASAKVTALAGTNNNFFQSLTLTNATTFILWVIVKLPDGGTPSSNDVQIIYSTAQTTTFRSLGNGLWAASASVTGNGSSTGTGVVVKSGRTVYVLYMAASSNTAGNLHYPCWGDLLGHAWTGTAHDSTSTRTAARVRVPVDASTFSLAQGAIVLAWKPYFANTFATDEFLFSCGSTSLRARFESSDDKFYFSDNTNEISSSAQTFAADDILWLAFVWGPSGLAIYKNGASIASGATYTPPALPSYVYLGTDDSAANPAYGPLMDARIYGQQLTAAEVLADYTNRSAVTADGQRDGSLPWLWTKDGDDVVDNHDDSGEDNWCVVGGVPGSAPAVTLIDATPSNTGTFADIYLSLLAADKFLAPGDGYCDSFGTGDANSSGGEYEGLSVNTSDVIFGNDVGALLQESLPNAGYWAGREAYIFARLQDAGSNLTIAAVPETGVATEYLAISAAATMRLFKTVPFTFRSKASYLGDYNPDGLLRHNAVLYAKRSSAGAATVGVDWLRLMFRPLLRLGFGTAGNAAFNYRDRTGVKGLGGNLIVTGDPIEFEPDRYNHLVVILGEIGADPVITRTLTFDAVKVTPRYSLL